AIEKTRALLVREFGADPVKYSEARAALCGMLLEAAPGLGLEEFESLDNDAAASDGPSLNGIRLIAGRAYISAGQIDPAKQAFRKVSRAPPAPGDFVAFASFYSVSFSAGDKNFQEMRARLSETIKPAEAARGPRFAALYNTLIASISGNEKLF